MEQKLYLHSYGASQALAYALVDDDLMEVFFSKEYPSEQQDDAIEWLGMHLDGTAGCSQYEWQEAELVEGDNSALNAVRDQWKKDPRKVRAKLIYMDTVTVVRTGPPLGRADDGEPPAPAAG